MLEGDPPSSFRMGSLGNPDGGTKAPSNSTYAR